MSDRTINDSIQKLAGTFNRDHISIVPCTVKSVNQQARNCICTPIGGHSVTDITNVQLMAEVDDGLLLLPAIDSTVFVCYSAQNTPFIILFSAIQKVLLVSVEGIQLQGGELGGLVIAKNLTDQLNKIEIAFNELNAKVNSLAPTPVIPPLTETTTAQIENNAITQGGV